MPSAHNFSNPVMALAIVNDFDGDKRIPLWTNANQASAGGDDRLPNMAVVSDVTIEYEVGMLPKITATLSFPYVDGIKFLENEVIAWGFSRLEVQFGYSIDAGSTDVSPVFSGLLHTPDVQIGEQVVITLVAIGGEGGYDAATRGSAVQIEGTREEIITQLLKGNLKQQRKLDVRFDEVKALGAGTDEFDQMFKDKIQHASGWTSDWLTIMKLVGQAKCWATFNGKTMEVFPLSSRITAKPRFVVQMYPPPGVPFGPGALPETDGGVWPIVSFNSPTVGIFFNKLSQGLFFKGTDSATGKPVSEPVEGTDDEKDTTPWEKLLGSGKKPKKGPSNPEGNKKTGDGMVPYHSDQLTEDDKRKARAEKAYGQFTNGLKVEIETFGMPSILPGELLQIRGMGRFFDVNVKILKLTHVLGEGGFTTMLEGYTNTPPVEQEAEPEKGTHGNEESDTEQDQGNNKKGKNGG